MAVTRGYKPIITNGLAVVFDPFSPALYSGSGASIKASDGQPITISNSATYSATGGGYIQINKASLQRVIWDNSATYNYTTGDFSINHWVSYGSFTTEDTTQGPITFYQGGFNTAGYYLQAANSSPSALAFRTNQSGAGQATTSTASLVVDTWYNICCTRSGAAVKIYINGVDATSGAGTHVNPAASTDQFRIGSYFSTLYGTMKISHLAIYSRALSAAEVVMNFNALRGRYGV